MKILYFILLISLLSACKNGKNPDAGEILEADKNFSATSVEKGYPVAFVEFAHPEAVILRPNSMPVKGKNAISALYENADTTGVYFTWEPIAADISTSGDLGFTYGTYSFRKDSVTERGTYASIWKRDADGNWKYILDVGNEGLEKK